MRPARCVHCGGEITGEICSSCNKTAKKATSPVIIWGGGFLVLCVISILALLSVVSAKKEDQSEVKTVDIQQMIKQEELFNNRCRDGSGDDPKTLSYCDQRDRLVSELGNNGWCFRQEDQFEAEKTWQKCSIASQGSNMNQLSLPAAGGDGERSFKPPSPAAYATRQRQLREDAWLQGRQNHMRTAENVEWAVTCNAIDAGAGRIIIGTQRNDILMAHGSIDPNFMSEEHAAIDRGRQDAKSRGCQTWLDHPEIVASLRAMAYDQ